MDSKSYFGISDYSKIFQYANYFTHASRNISMKTGPCYITEYDTLYKSGIYWNLGWALHCNSNRNL